ncbi:phage portal protein [Mesorhizobium sp. CAU 1741]|uniref:phage portal protein n=1 Tax=Mesorhizobium sp. CAU 1741 TaxID=3140366 RepID=UPI00325AFE57
MGILARLSTEERWPERSRVGSNQRTIAGVHITPDSAVTISTVWACLRYLSQTVATPPWRVLLAGRQGAQVQRSNPVDALLHMRPSSEWSSFQFRETLTHWALRWGNGYAEIEPDMMGRAYAMWPIHPDRVECCRAVDAREDAYGDMIAAGELYYEVSDEANGKTILSARRMFHIRGFGEGPVGVNVIDYAAQSLGWARAAQIFGAAYFGNGATPATVVKNKKGLTEAGLARQKSEFEALYKGPWRSQKTAFLDNDADIEVIGQNVAETQLIEVHQHLVEEICRWFGVPPHKVMHLMRATFSNIEHQAIEVVVDSITPWTKRFEDEADFKLFGQNRRGLYTKINLNALMRGDTKTRMEYYKGMTQIGAYSPNRVLELEDENTIGEDGDIHVMQEQMTTLKTIREKTIAPSPAPAHKPAPSDEDADEEAQMAMRVFIEAGGKVSEHVEDPR